MSSLNTKRGNIKAQLTRFYTHFNSLTLETAVLENIKERVSHLDTLFEKYDIVQLEIESSAKDEDIEEIQADRSQVEDNYFGAKSIAAQFIRQLEINDYDKVEGASNANAADSNMVGLSEAIKTLINNQAVLTSLLSENRQSSSSKTVQQPITEDEFKLHTKLEIPTFNGIYKDWPEFHDSFNKLIHNNTKYSDGMKLQFLKKALTGKAKDIFKNLPATDANYREAYQELLDTFNKSDLIIDSYLKNIMDQKRLQVATADGLRIICNNISEAVRALRALGQPTEHWDAWLVYAFSSKLDDESQKLWRRERNRAVNQLPTFAELTSFVKNRIYELSVLKEHYLENKSIRNSEHLNRSKVINAAIITSNAICVKCKGKHGIYTCPDFLQMSITARREFVKQKKLCFNCLKGNHLSKSCPSKNTCRICHNRHNTLVHEDHQLSPTGNSNVELTENTSITLATHTVMQSNECFTTILPTAIVFVKNKYQEYQKCRILLDTGSQASLITQNFVQSLNIKPSFDRRAIRGIGTSTPVSYTKGMVNVILQSRFNEFKIATDALIVDRLTSFVPIVKINRCNYDEFSGLQLADPFYDVPAKIDMIVGPDIFFQVLQNGRIFRSPNRPMAFETQFGWVLSGKSLADQPTSTYSLHSCIEVESTLQKFWELEDIQMPLELTAEEKLAEEHFCNTHYRNDEARYIVRLPFKDNVQKLGESKKVALQRVFSMEKRFERDSNLKLYYSAFIQEYQQLNHMTKVSNNKEDENTKFYLPHHSVTKESSTTTKLRVVFNASQKSSTNVSLNDLLLVGPTIQKDIFCLLLSFRKYRFAYVADIAKMYRQILVDRLDTPFQKILWRDSTLNDVEEFELLTVTYGTASAPFLATRCLKQLAEDERHHFPIGSKNLEENFYVDDFVGGSHTLKEALQVKCQLSLLLNKGGFNLRKWCANSKEFLNTIEQDQQESLCVLPGEEEMSIKTLGMKWLPDHDYFTFQVNIESIEHFTKRIILSEIGKLYDPLGFLAPCTVYVKILLQEIWVLGCNWDDSLPENIIKKYNSFRDTISVFQSLRIPRWLNITKYCSIQLCGFSDASEYAYAAVIYLRVVVNDTVYVEFVTAKSRVAPIKQVSLPRLELCGAHLLSRLVNKVRVDLNVPNIDTIAFTDSTIVLAWLRELPRKWKCFIANRTSSIQSIIPYRQWQHVKSKENPADAATRGLLPSDLINCELWWKGPKILHNIELKVDQSFNHFTTQEESRIINSFLVQADVDKSFDNLLFEKYSSLRQLQRVTAYMFRFIFNCRVAVNKSESKKIITDITFVKPLTVLELKSSLEVLIKTAQAMSFKKEISCLSKNLPLPHKSCLNQLNPFIDDKGMLRVGGRLQHSAIIYDKKHPIILHRQHSLAQLIVRDVHQRYFHAGQQLLLNILHLRYWIIGCKQLVRSHIFKCTTCIRFRATTANQQMGSLPSFRIQPSRPFANTGTDFAGPFTVKTWKGRGAKTLKSYVVIFICTVTRALHLELVSDLSTDMFLAALHRFMARRGFCSNIYSDNGRNYVGAARKISEITTFLRQHSNEISTELSKNEIQWHFIPVYTPHFGGLWESAVKSVKTHMKAVINNTTLTQEEMLTLLCQIEACLNSRPIAPKSFDINDLEALTPGHFLVQSSLLLPPQESQDLNATTYSSRWQLLQRINQHFWKRWSMEYISTLQARKKWQHRSKNLQINDLVLIKEDNLAPCVWALGRIISTSIGKDGLIRVVKLQTQRGIIERPIHKLCVLVSEESQA